MLPFRCRPFYPNESLLTYIYLLIFKNIFSFYNLYKPLWCHYFRTSPTVKSSMLWHHLFGVALTGQTKKQWLLPGSCMVLKLHKITQYDQYTNWFIVLYFKEYVKINHYRMLLIVALKRGEG